MEKAETDAASNKSERQTLSQRIMGFDAYTWNKRCCGTARIVGFERPVRLI